MNRCPLSFAALAAFLLLYWTAGSTLSAQQNDCAEGGCAATAPPAARTAAKAAQAPAGTEPLSFFRNYFIPGDYAAAGTGVRGTGEGTIVLSGVPSGATVLAAFLYWETLGNGAAGVFNGRAIRGTTLGTVTSPCWDPPLITVYRADVLSLLKAGVNGSYRVTFPDDGDFQSAPSTEGASLVVVYQKTGLPYKGVVIYDGAYTVRGQTPRFDLTIRNFSQAITPRPQARITHIVGDGQYWVETLQVNGTTFGSPTNPFTAAAGEKWDNLSFDVSSVVQGGATSLTTSVFWPPDADTDSDCLTWGAVVFSTTIPRNSNLELVDPVSELLEGSSITANASLLSTRGQVRDGVAADGAARLVVRYAAPAAGRVLFTLTDQNGVPVTPEAEYGGLRGLAGTALPVEGVETAVTPGGFRAFAVFQAPDRFVRTGSQDSTQAERFVYLRARFVPPSGPSVDTDPVLIRIVRPPVMLVHGLWSDESAWAQFPLASSTACEDSGRFYACRISYWDLNAAKFAQIAPRVGASIRQRISSFRKARNVAAVRADAIGHSMGGVIIRTLPLCGTEFRDCDFQYRISNNLGAGDIHRLITIGTPHQGTPAANRLWQFREQECGWGFWKAPLWERFAERGNDISGGAVEDLQADVGAIVGLNSQPTPFPMHVAVGVAGAGDASLFANNEGMFGFIRKYCGDQVLPATPQALYGEASDLVVPVSSQRHRQARGATGTTDSDINGGGYAIHTAAVNINNQAGYSSEELVLRALGDRVLRVLDEGGWLP